MAKTAAEYRNSASRAEAMKDVIAKKNQQSKAYNDLFYYPAGEPRKVKNETTGEVSYGSKRYEDSKSTIDMRVGNRKRNRGA